MVTTAGSALGVSLWWATNSRDAAPKPRQRTADAIRLAAVAPPQAVAAAPPTESAGSRTAVRHGPDEVEFVLLEQKRERDRERDFQALRASRDAAASAAAGAGR